MRGSVTNAIRTAILVAKAGCVGVKRRVGVASVTTALALILGLGVGGCAQAHGNSGVDMDGDGYENDVDCNDSDPNIYPGAPESFPLDCCDMPAVDMDCDGVPLICTCNPFPDFDGDGYLAGEDCNDNDATIYPGAPEDPCASDGIDRDCDGVPPNLACNFIPDADGDGYLAGDDCDDDDALIYPGAPEEECPDGVDNDCDGVDGDPETLILCGPADADGDGYPRYSDCDDTNPGINPGVEEWDCPDGVDQDCDGIDGDLGIICNGMADAPDDDYCEA